MNNEKNYVLGKGKVYFDRFADDAVVTAATRGEGERYIGNTPEYSTSSSSESLDHYSSEGGVKVKDESVQLSQDRTGRLTADNISAENIALFYLGEAGSLVQTALVGEEETLAVKKGRFYQLGMTDTNQSGHRSISNVVVDDGSGTPVVIVASGNYTVDLDLGRIYVEDDAPDITDGDELHITYDVAASTREQIVSGENTIYGALRFVADNPKGENRDHYYPYVKLTPDGDYALKGDEWQSMGFTFEILKKTDTTPAAYIDGRATANP